MPLLQETLSASQKPDTQLVVAREATNQDIDALAHPTPELALRLAAQLFAALTGEEASERLELEVRTALQVRLDALNTILLAALPQESTRTNHAFRQYAVL